MVKPEPKSINVVCTVCGLSWEAHLQGRPSKDSKRAATLEDCVRVQKAELAKRPAYANQFSGSAYYALLATGNLS